MTVRVLVVGGGVIGLSCAWRLAEAGNKVTVVAPELLREGAAAWKEFAMSLERASGREVGYDQSGMLIVGLDASDRAALDQLLDYQLSLGCTAHRRTASECRALVPALTPAVRGGIEAPGDNHVDNRALLGALLSACGAKGVHVVAQRVESVCPGAGGPEVVLSDGSRLGTDYLVVAAGTGTAHIRGLEEAGLPEIRPVKGHILRLGPAVGAVAGASRGAGAVGPPLIPRTVRALVHGRPIYLVPRPDRTLVVGATMEERGTDVTVRAGAVHELLSDARAIVPGVDELELLEAQAGLRPATPDNTPVVGWTDLPGVAVASGHFRNGMLLAPWTAATVVEMVAGAVATGAVARCGAADPSGAARGPRGGGDA